jgi:hypothetical protein
MVTLRRSVPLSQNLATILSPADLRVALVTPRFADVQPLISRSGLIRIDRVLVLGAMVIVTSKLL